MRRLLVAAALSACTRETHPKVGIVLSNEMGSFSLFSAQALIDDQPVFTSSDPTMPERKLMDLVRDVPLGPGEHTLSIQLKFHGKGTGVFDYLKGYTFVVKSAHSFALAGRGLNIRVHAYERGGVTTPIEERPAIRYEP